MRRKRNMVKYRASLKASEVTLIIQTCFSNQIISQRNIIYENGVISTSKDVILLISKQELMINSLD